MFRELSRVIVAALTGGDIARYTLAKDRLGDYVEERLAERADATRSACQTNDTATDRSGEPCAPMRG
jgi:hypothetical protein